MFSTLRLIVLIFLCLTQNICYCSNCFGKDEKQEQQNFWDTVKETVSEASENDLLKFGLTTGAIAGAAIVATHLYLQLLVSEREHSCWITCSYYSRNMVRRLRCVLLPRCSVLCMQSNIRSLDEVCGATTHQ
ncbi:hypothetical protein TNCT_571131 [Trichonephila clavata]|uniref:Uncharacterized protein n=1 Tax=Trichonephila clavata TaxID=2740835 RepID=A0A8X6K9L4_TRICU|nr:hypothetical protein TNCT_571131 [Trichonephila clavata]